jgi:hypothetical protein
MNSKARPVAIRRMPMITKSLKVQFTSCVTCIPMKGIIKRRSVPKVQKAREKFCYYYARTSDDWAEDWMKEFNNILEENARNNS